MRVKLIDKKNNEFDALIEVALNKDLKLASKSWKLNWFSMVSKGASFYKLSYKNKLQGLIKLEVENEEYIILKNIEIAPSNYGSNGKYKNVAESFMAFACLETFKKNKGNYKGYLVFTSKGELIE